jgi:cell division protein FtsB
MQRYITDIIKKYLPYLNQLQDIRVAGLVVFGIIVLLISWSGVKSIDTNYRLQREIARLQQENKVLELNNSNSELQNDYYKTDQYLELSARQNLGLAKPGETELIVPKEVTLKYSAAPPATTAATAKASSKQPAYQKNLQAWVNFFLHRQNPAD